MDDPDDADVIVLLPRVSLSKSECSMELRAKTVVLMKQTVLTCLNSHSNLTVESVIGYSISKKFCTQAR